MRIKSVKLRSFNLLRQSVLTTDAPVSLDMRWTTRRLHCRTSSRDTARSVSTQFSCFLQLYLPEHWPQVHEIDNSRVKVCGCPLH
jgi:hypothetical protein